MNIPGNNHAHLGIRRLEACRVCGARELVNFLHLPEMPLTDDFVTSEQVGREFLADIDIFACTRCWTAQTQHDVDFAKYYEDYQYSVGGSAAASHFMRTLAENLRDRYFPGSKGRKVLEVGSGDGGQLLAFKDAGFRVLGYEPSSALCKVARTNGLDTIQGLFIEESLSALPADFQEVDVVALSYTFDHLPDPRSFLRACRSILNMAHGLVVVEVHDFQKIIERREYCLFEHEHSVYLTEETAHVLCEREGFVIIDYDLVAQQDRRANSLIFVAAHKGSIYANRTIKPRTQASFSGISQYERIGSDVRLGIENLDTFVRRITDSGKRVCGYGAGGRGVMTLAAMETASRLLYLVDKQPKGVGLFVPKSRIPLVGLEMLETDPVDEVIVFSFGYMREIQTQLYKIGYRSDQIHSLLDLLAGDY